LLVSKFLTVIKNRI